MVLTLKTALPIRVTIVQQAQTQKNFVQTCHKLLKVEETETKNATAAKDILEVSCGFRQSLKAVHCVKLIQNCMSAIKQDEDVTKGSSDDIQIRAIVMLIDQGIVGTCQKHL
jgi:hypothetical protein